MSSRVKWSYRDSHLMWLAQRCAPKGWFSLEVCSDFTELKIDMGNRASEANKPHDSQPIDTKMAKMRTL